MPGSYVLNMRRQFADRGARPVHRRRQITAALATACAEWGYRDTTIDDVAAHARMSRNTIYQHYSDKEAIFIDLLKMSAEELRAEAKAACAAAGPDVWDQVSKALSSVLSWVSANPDAARALLCEAEWAGSAALEVKNTAIGWFSEQLEERLPSDSGAPPAMAQLVVGGAESIVRREVLSGGFAGVTALAEHLEPCLRIPFDAK
jgi:AcrR family transcriptional regulator